MIPRIGGPTVLLVVGLVLIAVSVWRLWSPEGAALVAGVLLCGLALVGAWRAHPRARR